MGVAVPARMPKRSATYLVSQRASTACAEDLAPNIDETPLSDRDAGASQGTPTSLTGLRLHIAVYEASPLPPPL